MKTYNFTDAPLTEKEQKNLETLWELIDDEGKEFMAFGLVGEGVVVLLDMNQTPTAETLKQETLRVADETMSNMPDFCSEFLTDKKIAWVTMDGGLILGLVPYLDEYDNYSSMPLSDALYGRSLIMDACDRRQVKCISWYNDAREVKIE